MSKNPHATLNIRADATQDEIRKAYRAACLQHHPDRGGDRERFEEAQAAYDELTGKKGPDNQQSVCYSYINEYFIETVVSIVQTGTDPAAVDIMAQIKQKVQAEIKVLRGKQDEGRQVLAQLEKMQGRFMVTARDAPNIFEGVIAEQVRSIKKRLEAIDDRLRVANGAMLFLSQCRYTFDAKAAAHAAMRPTMTTPGFPNIEGLSIDEIMMQMLGVKFGARKP